MSEATAQRNPNRAGEDAPEYRGRAGDDGRKRGLWYLTFWERSASGDLLKGGWCSEHVRRIAAGEHGRRRRDPYAYQVWLFDHSGIEPIPNGKATHLVTSGGTWRWIACPSCGKQIIEDGNCCWHCGAAQ